MSKNINESLPKEQRVRQVGVNNQGEKITIIRCSKLEDGTPLVWRYLSINHNKILRGKDISKLHSNISQEVA